VISPPSHLFVRHINGEEVIDGVDVNDVAILNKGDRTADLCLGHDMAHHEAVRAKISNGAGLGTHPPLKRPSVRQATS